MEDETHSALAKQLTDAAEARRRREATRALEQRVRRALRVGATRQEK